MLIDSGMDSPPLLFLFTGLPPFNHNNTRYFPQKVCPSLNTPVFTLLRKLNQTILDSIHFTHHIYYSVNQSRRTETTFISAREAHPHGAPIRPQGVCVREPWPAYAKAIVGRKDKICGIYGHYRRCVN